MNTIKGYTKVPTKLYSRHLVDFAIKQVLDMRVRRAIKNANPQIAMEERERKSSKGNLKYNKKILKILNGCLVP